MTEKWRLIDMRIEDAPTQMAIDEAIAIARLKHDTHNTIRMYRWQPSAVSIGYFQSIQKEVNLEACKEYGVDVIRRITGFAEAIRLTRGSTFLTMRRSY